MRTNADLYDHDFYAWVQEQAALLKARQFEAIDLDNLIEEVASIARQERHLLWHRFRTLLTHLVAWWGEIPAHCIQWEGVIAAQRQEIQDILADSPSLLKWAYQPQGHSWGHSWVDSIRAARTDAQALLARYPHLRPRQETAYARAYPRARRQAARETGLPLATFPEACPWTPEQILAEDFWPEATP